MSTPRARWQELAPALFWLVLAASVACARVPYDDEWFSIELALHSDSAHFFSALAGDGHPPWVAMLDRALGTLWASRYPLHLARVVASTAAFALSAGWIARRLRLPAFVPLIGALHPIVLMYGGAARWYPFLLLAHALRARALWGDDRPAGRRGLFVAGALVGAGASYLDLWFLVHDAGFWLAGARAREQAESQRSSALVAALAFLGVFALDALSPLGLGHVFSAARGVPALRGVVTFAALGVFGEASFGLAWAAFGFGVALAFGYALFSRLRERPLPPDAVYAASLCCAWAVAAAFGAWHARYGLWLWFLLGAHLLCLLRGGPVGRALLTLNASFMLQVWLAMALGGWFYKLDLNHFTDADCNALRRAAPSALTIASHPRLAALIEQRCVAHGPLVRIPSIRIVPDLREQMGDLAAALQRHSGTVVSLRVNAQSSLVYTDDRVRATLAARCHPTGIHEFGDVPHRWLRHYLAPASDPEHRFTLETWECP